MRLRRLLSRALVLPIAAASLAVAAGAPAAHAAGFAPEEHCLTLDGDAVLCFTVGAEFTPAPAPNYTAAGTLTLTIGCRSDYITTALCSSPITATVKVDQTGVVQGDPRVEVAKIYELHVPQVCFDDVCGPAAFDMPVYAPVVAGSIATVYVGGEAYPIGLPSCTFECTMPSPGHINEAAEIANALLAFAGVGGDGISVQ